MFGKLPLTGLIKLKVNFYEPLKMSINSDLITLNHQNETITTQQWHRKFVLLFVRSDNNVEAIHAR